MKTFFSWVSPGEWLALLVALLVALAVGGGIGYRVADNLAQIRELKAQGEIVTERLAHSAELARETGKVASLTEARSKDSNEVAVKHKEEMDNAKTTIDALRTDVRSGVVRLSIATRQPIRPSGGATSDDPAPAGSLVEEARAELVPAAADALIGIAADGDDAVRDFNACHDAYEAVRLRVIQ